MTVLQTPQEETASTRPLPSTDSPLARRPRGRSLSTVQRIVVAAAALPLIGIVLTTIAGALGLIPTEQMLDTALLLGEEPGMFVFAAMLLCTPVQWLVKRTQVPVRKLLGILFSGYAVSNFAMFVIDEGLADTLSAPFLIAGTAATAASIPLLLTSGRWAQRTMGMRNWRALHKLTYAIAIALVLHLVLIGELGISGALIIAALTTRIPPVAKAIQAVGQRRHARAEPRTSGPVPLTRVQDPSIGLNGRDERPGHHETNG